jgi:hypothetical protein
MEPSPDNPGHATLTLTQPPKCQNPRGRRSRRRRRRRERTHLVTGRLPLHKSWTSTNRPEEERKRAAERSDGEGATVEIGEGELRGGEEGWA